ncbi:MAG TPA: GatB/YqeY domain-containing protein [Candidatus Nanopelagicales bacterium]|nr:GatB/YqeY domain-containing protein [Candidatus Nanopelagicales bacterium]
MSLRDRLHEEMTAATRSRDVLRRDTLRMVWSAVYAVEKRDHATLTDDQALAVLTREVKTRRESVEAYRKGGREDLAAKEEAEIVVIAGFLPEALSETEIAALVDEGIAATGAASARDLGKVMGWLSPRTRGRADGRVVSGLVAAALARAELAAHDGGHGGVGRG